VSQIAPEDKAVVVAKGRRYEVHAGATFTFGRDPTCSVCLDPTDRGISRISGSIASIAGTWWLNNVSESRLLIVVDEQGVRLPLAPGRIHVVDQAHLSVIVPGSVLHHELRVEVASPARPGSVHEIPRRPTPTLSKDELRFNDDDLVALAALFSGYLETFPRYDPHPTRYAIAARRLGWKRSTLIKRIENMRSRLTRSGVPGLVGENALEALAEFVLISGVITRADLGRLPPMG
jgi:hypothetical protein